MQIVAKIQNKSIAWSANLRPRVLDTVILDNSYYSNVTGKNSNPSSLTDWIFIGSSVASAAFIPFYKNDFIIDGSGQIVVPSGVEIHNLSVNFVTAKAADWSQLGDTITIIGTLSGDIITVNN